MSIFTKRSAQTLSYIMTKLENRRRAPVSYISTVSVSDRIFFLRLIFRWTGSVWQTLWVDLFIFLFLFITMNIFYTCFLSLPGNEQHRVKFEAFVDHVQKIASGSPLSMLLGFFVTAVLTRWWEVAMKIPTTTTAASLLQAYVAPSGRAEEARKVRVTILRYMNLSWVLGMRPICRQIAMRFRMPKESKLNPLKLRQTVDGLIHKRQAVDDRLERLEKLNEDSCVKEHFGSLVTREEMEILINIDKAAAIKTNQDYWIPLQWCQRILSRSRETGIIVSDFYFRELIHMIDDFRNCLATLQTYDTINIPLVYTQVIIIAVYAFVLAEIFSSQVIKAENSGATFQSVVGNSTRTGTPAPTGLGNYVPVFSIFKFIFFMGWFKTAASLLNPLGNDQEALPTSLILDENMSVSIQSGGAGDELYPSSLRANGEGGSQLDQLSPQPNFVPQAQTPDTEIDEAPC